MRAVLLLILPVTAADVNTCQVLRLNQACYVLSFAAAIIRANSPFRGTSKVEISSEFWQGYLVHHVWIAVHDQYSVMQ